MNARHGTDPADVYAFAPEETPPGDTGASPQPSASALEVLSVDDDAAFQGSLRLALRSFRFQSRPIRLSCASSATEAAALLSTMPDVAVIILDVVMETDDAGLRLIRSVREVLGNAEVRIVLVTGQPGMAPMGDTLRSLDISDYWLKTDLTLQRLHGVLTSNLRTWQQIRALGRARKGLQTIVEASNSMTRARDLDDFSGRVMQELARLLGLESDGLVCVREQADGSPPHSARITGATGRLAHAVNSELGSLEDAGIRELLLQSLRERRSIEAPACQVIFFPGDRQGPHAATYIATPRPLDHTERELVRVFASNINSGLINVSLTSQLDRIAYEDPLLRMPNANALIRAIDGVLDVPPPRQRSLLFLELDQYSASCLTLGTEQGDLMLQRMAKRLRSKFPPPTMVARLYDDTFAILGDGALLKQERIDELESQDPDDPEHPPFIRVRAALLDLDRHKGSARSAMAVGALLLRRARSQGAIEMVEHEPALERETQQRFTRSRELYHALRSGGIGIALQPQVELAGLRVIGAEALARWTLPDGSTVPPLEFIQMAEANGLIVPLGRQVLELACRALAGLREAGFPEVGIAVNVSPIQLARRDFMHELTGIVRDHGVDAQRLEIEITETAAILDYETNGRLLRGLRDAGFPIAIDDFGTGYSSLGHLRSMPATTLKVDRCFVAEIGVVAPERVIADTVLRLGERLGMQVLAEGVETEAQARWLAERGCPRAQGYLFGRPEPLEAFVQRLRTGPGA